MQWVGQAGGGVARSWHRPWWASCTPARHVASCSSHRFLNINRGSGSGLLQLTEVSKQEQRSGSCLLQITEVPEQEQRSVVASCSSQRFLNRSRGQVVASCSSQRFLNRSWGQVVEETVEFNRFFQIERGKTASAARNWTNFAPITDVTTFAFASLSILLLWYVLSMYGTYCILWIWCGPPGKKELARMQNATDTLNIKYLWKRKNMYCNVQYSVLYYNVQYSVL